MFDLSEVQSLMKVNGLDSTSSLEAVNNFLTQIKYTEADKQEVVGILKLQGWFTTEVTAQQLPSKVDVPPAPPTTSPYSPVTSVFVAPQSFTTIQPPVKKSSIGMLVSILGLGTVLLISGGLVYAYVEKIGPFSTSSYSEENLFSGLLLKISEINSASYKVSASLDIVKRDNDAKPFDIKTSNNEELNKKYYYDAERLKSASAIISELNNLSGYYISSYYNPDQKPLKPYTNNLSSLFAKGDRSYYPRDTSNVDPVTKREYEYKVTEGGNNFFLTVNFETDQAIKNLKKYGYVSTATIIKGKTVSFTKNSKPYVYMSSEPPKPFLVQMGESIRMLPADTKIKGSFKASSQIKSDGIADWLFNVSAEGDFGDLSYKVNADALKKDEDYYFKINNMPSLFLFGELSSVKGKWVKISSKGSTKKDSYSTFGYVESTIQEAEKKYQENRSKFTKFIKKVVEIADQEKLAILKSNPRSEKVDGRKLVRYELSFKKDAILSFYTKLLDEMNKDPDFADYQDFVDQGLVDYLQSEEFTEVFEYFDKNNSLILWTDDTGFPAMIQNSMRVVPLDTAIQLKDKQIMFVFSLEVSDINENVNIEAPNDSVTIDELTAQVENNLSPERMKGKVAALKANLNNIRASAELNYDTNNNSYGKKPFSLGKCRSVEGTLFADSYISRAIDSSTENNMSLATCVSKGNVGSVSSWAISVPLPDKDGFSWCVDSFGASKEIIGAIKSDRCE